MIYSRCKMYGKTKIRKIFSRFHLLNTSFFSYMLCPCEHRVNIYMDATDFTALQSLPRNSSRYRRAHPDYPSRDMTFAFYSSFLSFPPQQPRSLTLDVKSCYRRNGNNYRINQSHSLHLRDDISQYDRELP